MAGHGGRRADRHGAPAGLVERSRALRGGGNPAARSGAPPPRGGARGVGRRRRARGGGTNRRGSEKTRPPAAAAGRGIILISIDTLRADHLGCYGYATATSPTIDALARRGALFSHAASTSSWTLPAHMSMLTSLYPSFHKLEKGGVLGSTRLDDSETTLAMALRAAGFATAGIVAHPYLSAEWGFDRGFDLYRRYSSRAAEQTERAMLWLAWHRFHVERGLRGPDFFLFLHYIDPHEPYDAPDGYAKKFFPDYAGRLRPQSKLVTAFSDRPFASPVDLRYALALYDGEIAYVDAELAKLLEEVERLGLRDSTLLVLSADHGEEIKDHGSMGHKETLYEEVLHVPLVLVLPARIAAGQRIDLPVSVLDIAPTILDFSGQNALPGAQGISLRPSMKIVGEAPQQGEGEAEKAPRRPIFAELGPLDQPWERSFRRKAVRTGALQLIVTYAPPAATRRELFDLSSDPTERNDVYGKRADDGRVRALEQELDGFIRAGRAYKPGDAQKNEMEIDPATRERLKALGYME
jgi:arylsulfatase A-like enzyme